MTLHPPPLLPAESLEGKARNKSYLLEQLGLPEAISIRRWPGIVSRLVHQKGFDLCFDVLPELLATSDLRLVVLGSGEPLRGVLLVVAAAAFPGGSSTTAATTTSWPI